MSNQIVEDAKDKFVPPKDFKDVLALLISVVIGFGFVQFAAPFINTLEFIDPSIRSYVGGLGLAIIVPLYNALKNLFDRIGGDAKAIRPDLPPWFATGATAGVLLFVWFQFVSFVAVFAISHALRPFAGADGGSTSAAALQQGISFAAFPLTGIAAFFGGVLLNRNTRSMVILSLLLAALVFAGLHLMILATFDPRSFAETLHNGVAPLVAGLLIALIFLFGAAGVVVSAIMGDRSIGRLVRAARRLKVTDRDRLTENALRTLESRI